MRTSGTEIRIKAPCKSQSKDTVQNKGKGQALTLDPTESGDFESLKYVLDAYQKNKDVRYS